MSAGRAGHEPFRLRRLGPFVIERVVFRFGRAGQLDNAVIRVAERFENDGEVRPVHVLTIMDSDTTGKKCPVLGGFNIENAVLPRPGYRDNFCFSAERRLVSVVTIFRQSGQYCGRFLPDH